MSLRVEQHKPSLLVLARRVPWPLNGGGRIRLHHFMRELALQWQVTCASVEEPHAETQLPEDVQLISGSEIRRKPDSEPKLSVGQSYFGYDPELASWLRNEASNQYDALLIHSAANGVYAREADIPTAWDLCDELLLSEWRQLRRNLRRLPQALQSAAIVACHEHEVCQKVDITLVASEVDAKWLRAFNPGPIQSISSGVDLEFFQDPSDPPTDSHRIAFVGALEFPPNIDGVCWFAREIWPALRARHPEAVLQLVGRRPVSEVRALAAHPGIEVYADVPDVRPFFADARAVIAPLRMGGGVKTKILEASAMSRATVTTPLGLGDLTIPRGRAIFVGTRTEDWISSLSDLLFDQKLASETGRTARQWVRENHSWRHIGTEINRLISTMSDTVSYHGTKSSADTPCRMAPERSPLIG